MKVETLINAIRQLENRAVQGGLSPRKEKQLENIFSEAYERMYYKPSEELYGTSKVVGKHKVPRYMYHLTTEGAYEQMLKDGCIKPAQAMDSASGTFLFDLKNFTRFWRKTKNVAEQPRTTLLNEVAGKLGYEATGNIVMLKIPTSMLNARKLRIRRQKLVRCGHGKQQQEMQDVLNDPHRISNGLENLKYMFQGENVANVPLYNQRKEAIEFITPDAIPMSNVSLVGKAKVDTKITDKAHWEMQELPEVWKDLTKGTPEAKAFENMVK